MINKSREITEEDIFGWIEAKCTYGIYRMENIFTEDEYRSIVEKNQKEHFRTLRFKAKNNPIATLFEIKLLVEELVANISSNRRENDRLYKQVNAVSNTLDKLEYYYDLITHKDFLLFDMEDKFFPTKNLVDSIISVANFREKLKKIRINNSISISEAIH